MVNSRTQAQDFIAHGYVYILAEGKKKYIDKSNYLVKEFDQIQVEANELQRFVSRGGLKLEFAINKLQLSVANKTVLDVGQSTGGFTDCLLKRGAVSVVGVDVGQGQLHHSLKNNSQVYSFENINVKDLSMNAAFVNKVPLNNFDLIVADVSFISLTKIIPSISNFINEGGEYLFLVKPQFECGPENRDKNGLVKNAKLYKTVETDVRRSALQYFKNIDAYFSCDILGKDGNQEFFIYGHKIS